MSLTQITSHGIADGAIVNADLHTNAALALSKLNTSGTASSSTFLRGDGAWTAIDLSNLSASNLTSGTVPDARFPSTLPALDGSALTALNASNLASGTVGTARLGSGTASSSTFLRGDGSWQTMSADGGNAATLDSLDSSQFLRSDAHDEFSGQLVSTYSGDEKIILSGSSDPYIRFKEGTTTKSYVQWNASGYLEVVNQEDNSRIKLQDNLVFTNDGWSNTYKIWNESNDGSGSGLDADTLDGTQAAKFLSSYDRTTTTGWEDGNRNFRINSGGTSAGLAFHKSDGTLAFQAYGDGTYYGFLNDNWGNWDIKKAKNGNMMFNNSDSNIVWHAGNDGSGSGLDADTCDGQHLGSTASPLFAEVYSNGWFRNNDTGEGLYNTANNSHFYSPGVNYWHINNNSSVTNGGLILYGGYNATQGNATGRKGYLYWDANGFGLLHSGGGWAVRTTSSATTLFGTLTHNGSTIWHAGNDGSGSGLDADLLDGLQLGTGRNNSANQVVRTNSSGYIDTGYINTSCDDTGTGVDCKFYASEDDYIRYIDLRSMRSVVNSSARSSAYPGRESYSSDQNYWVGSMGHGADNFDSTVWDYGSGAFDVWSNPSGQPSGTSHWCGVQAMHYTNASNRYGMRLMLGAGQTALAYIQGRWGTTTYGWHKLWNEGNDGSGSGLDADLLDGMEPAGLFSTGHTQTAQLQLRGHTNSWDGGIKFISNDGNNTAQLHMDNSTNYDLMVDSSFYVGGDIKIAGLSNIAWHAGNDGSGSGLDADTCDGQHLGTSANVTFNDIYANNWHRNNVSGEGLYNDSTTAYFYSDHDDVYNVAGGSSANWIRFRDEHAGTIRGYVGANTSNVIGFLDYEGNFAFSSGKFTNYSHRDLCSQPDDGHDLGYGNRRWDNVYATNGTIQTSDRNEKENIVATDLGLAFVNKLSPVSFKRKGKTRTHYGFIAQDIEQIITDLGKTTTQFAPLIKSDISEAKDGSEYRYGLRYEQLLAPVVKAIQELAVKVAALESA